LSLRAAWSPTVPEPDTYIVRYDRLAKPVVVRGDVEAAANSDIICQVKNRTRGSIYATTIRWIIDDGTPVRRGQLLVQLDDSALEEELKARKLVRDQARDAWVQAEENYKIVDSQSQGNLKAAGVAVELAQLDLRKYLEGDYEQQRKDLAGRLSMAESDLEMWRDRVAFTERLTRRGFLEGSQVQADRSRLAGARLALEKLREESRVLQEYTYRRTVTQLEGRLREAERALDRVRCHARAADARADIDRLVKRRVYQRRLNQCRDIEEDIRRCTLIAPHDGLVVYADRGPGQRHDQPVVAQGEPVREKQLLMRLPDLTRLQITVRVHEALIPRIRGEVWEATRFGDGLRAALLLAPDTPTRLLGHYAFAELRPHWRAHERRLVHRGDEALIRTDAYPEHVLHGHVKRVAALASPPDGSAPDVPVYAVQVALEESFDGLRPGMSAQVTIQGDDGRGPVLAVPVRALFGSPALGRQRKCFVRTPAGLEARLVVIGAHNQQRAEIQSGLEEGDEVILNPQELLSKADDGGPKR
jgi:multidrug efflux pump subunit AcrA (membrane-fusion protein)